MTKSGSIQALWLGFVGLWLISFLLAFFSALVANGLWAVPLFQVINSSLAVSLFFVYLAMGLSAFGMVVMLLTGQFSDAVQAFIVLLIYALLPFGAIAAFSLYAWIGHLSLNGAFVYEDFMAKLGPIVRGTIWLLRKVSPGASLTTEGAFDLLRNSSIVLGSLASLVTIMRFFQRQAG